MSTAVAAVVVAAAPLRAEPDRRAEQVDEALFGERLEVLEPAGEWVRVRLTRDGYVGWMAAGVFAEAGAPPSHRVRAARTAALVEPSARAAAAMSLVMNALVRVVAREGRFALVEGAGWAPEAHLADVGRFETEPCAAAERFVGAPYLWGGRGQLGIDCSGLIQQALFACGRACPRNSDQQAALGRPITRAELGREDLVCWPGHIGLMLECDRLIHASGEQMAVVIEPLDAAISARLATVGPPAGFRRLSRL